MTPKISTAESLKARSMATTFSQTQEKTANSLVTKSLKMKHPTAKSLKMKNPVAKNFLTKYAAKKNDKSKNLTAKTPVVKKSTKKIDFKSFKSKGKLSNSNRTNK